MKTKWGIVAILGMGIAIASGQASDNSTSNVIPGVLIIGNPGLMSTGDTSTSDSTGPGTDPNSTDPNSNPPQDPPSDNTQVANAPNPNDSNYVQELQNQLQQQGQALNQAIAALANAQVQLQKAQQLAAAYSQYSGSQNSMVTTAALAYQTALAGYGNGSGSVSLSALNQAQQAYVSALNAAGQNATTTTVPNVSTPVVIPVPVAPATDTSQGSQAAQMTTVPNYNSSHSPYYGATNAGLALQVSITLLNCQAVVQADQILVQRLQAQIAQTQALLNAAQNGQSPPSQQGSTDNPGTDVSDAGNVTNSSIAGGGSADGGVADDGGGAGGTV